LLPNTVYYWKIVANDSLNTTAGPVWSFTTRNERAPTVSLAYPSNSQTGVSLSVTLQWSQADADSDPITPTVFFGTDPNALNGYSASDSSRSFFGLSPLTTYYWYVNVSDGMMSSKSSTWSFTTRSTPPLPPTSVCGNGVIEGGEQCDGSAPSGFTCQSCQLVGVGSLKPESNATVLRLPGTRAFRVACMRTATTRTRRSAATTSWRLASSAMVRRLLDTCA
jgi:hypothetical protein